MADKNKTGTLTLEECKTLVEQLNIKMDKETLRELFNVSLIQYAWEIKSYKSKLPSNSNPDNKSSPPNSI